MATRRRLEYTHQPINKDITSISGHYTLQREVRRQYGDREVLYIVGQAVADSACCGSGNWDYALVPGYIVSWQIKTNDTGQPVTEVEPISDKQVQAGIQRDIAEAEGVSRIEFW